MIASANPIVIKCACGNERTVSNGTVYRDAIRHMVTFDACPNCGTLEFFPVLKIEENPDDPNGQAPLIREVAADLGLIDRANPAYFVQPAPDAGGTPAA